MAVRFMMSSSLCATDEKVLPYLSSITMKRPKSDGYHDQFNDSEHELAPPSWRAKQSPGFASQ
jgi:hypothetical protein